MKIASLRLLQKKILTGILVFSITFIVSCTGIDVFRSGYGFEGNTHPTPEYSNIGVIYKGGGVIHRNTVPGALGKQREGELRRGEACSWSAVWLLAGGDSSIKAAKQLGGIDYIHFIEYKQEATFGFLSHNFCTIIVGTKAPKSNPTSQTSSKDSTSLDLKSSKEKEDK